MMVENRYCTQSCFCCVKMKNLMTMITIAVLCLASLATAVPTGHGHGHGPAVIGPSGVVTGAGATGPSGIVTGKGAIGPDGRGSWETPYDDGSYPGDGPHGGAYSNVVHGNGAILIGAAAAAGHGGWAGPGALGGAGGWAGGHGGWAGGRGHW